MGGKDDISIEIVREIEQLLLSRELQSGLELLDTHYRLPVCGYVRRWSETNHYCLSDLDVQVIWQETMLSVIKRVKDEKFKARDNVINLLLTISRCRAIDVLRQRSRGVKRAGRLDDVPGVRIDEPHVSVISDENLARIRAGIDKLTAVEKTVLEIHVSSKLTRKQLTAAVNAQLRRDFSEDAVKSILQRIRLKMSNYFRG